MIRILGEHREYGLLLLLYSLVLPHCITYNELCHSTSGHNSPVWIGSLRISRVTVTMTTESSTSGAVTLPGMNFSAYVGPRGHTVVNNAYYCMLFSSMVRVKIRVRIRFVIWLVSDYAHEFVLLFAVIVTLPFLGECRTYRRLIKRGGLLCSVFFVV